MDWWTFAAKSLAFRDSSNTAKVRHFVMDAKCQLLVAKTASTIWANTLLKHCDAVHGKVKDNISFESFMELHNAPLPDSAELFQHKRGQQRNSVVSCMTR